MILTIVLLFIIIYFLTRTEAFVNKGTHGYNKVWTSRTAFDTQALGQVQREYAEIRGRLRSENSLFGRTIINRKKFIPRSDSALNQVLKDQRFITRLENIIGIKGLVLNETTLPPEYRIYEKGGEMKWHRDTVLSTPPQYEVVITLFNDSDSQFLWKNENANKINRADTNTNNITIVRAGGIEHAVSPVTRGKRVIIKAAYDQKVSVTPKP